MILVDLASQPQPVLDAAAQLLVSGFEAPSGWATVAAARRDVAHVLEEGFARGAIVDDRLVGWIGALPEYDGRVWELHPLVVSAEYRSRGIGRSLVAALEAEVAARGGLTITLGTDDDTGRTSLSNGDLYADIPAALRDLRDLGRGHPFQFYQWLGYTVTGVLPDANGVGKPDIFMSKRVTDVRRP
jgi:aminoglycoside 6'-N-acetyltransferase I